MSVKNSISTNSTSSSATMSKIRPNEPTMDPSNILYNDHENYQIIFTNDSRFFDTSLHLFKSYCDLGYVKLENKKSKKKLFPPSPNTSKSPANRLNSSWRPKSIGFSSNHTVNGNLNGTTKSPFLRHNDHSTSHRSDPGTSKIKRGNLPLIVSSQRQSTPYDHPLTNDEDSDDPDIIITRL